MRTSRSLAVLAVVLPTIAPSAAQEPGTSGPDPNKGRFLAIGGQSQSGRASCVQCHGLEGLGDSSGAFPRLAGLDGWTLYKALRDYAAGLRESEIMGPVAAVLTDREMQDVAAWYAGFDELPYEAQPEISAEERQLGAALVAVGAPERGIPACSSCHGQNGIGGGVAFPRIAGQYAPYLEHQLNKWREGTRDGDPMNVMEQVARGMSEEDVRLVSLYLAAVDPLAAQAPAEETVVEPPLAEPGPEPPYLPAPDDIGTAR